jgi:2-keto-3-deoxy-L-rhamnonate aldolase RhmA
VEHVRDLFAREDRRALGTWLKIAHNDVADLLALAGFDFVVVDMEHAPIGIGDAHRLIGAALGAGLPPLVRVPELDESVVARVLDSGAHGVLVPHVRTAEDAERIVRAARLPPRGTRGFGPTVRSGGWGADPDSYRRSAARSVVIPQIECADGVRNVGAIADVEGIDHLFVGTADLAESTGLAPTDPAFGELLAAVSDAAAAHGVPLGTAVGATGAPPPRLGDCRFFAVSNDAGLLLHGARSVLSRHNSPSS